MAQHALTDRFCPVPRNPMRACPGRGTVPVFETARRRVRACSGADVFAFPDHLRQGGRHRNRVWGNTRPGTDQARPVSEKQCAKSMPVPIIASPGSKLSEFSTKMHSKISK